MLANLNPNIRTALLGSTAIAVAGGWLVSASAIFLYGTGLIGHVAYTPDLWLSYLPYAGENATVADWLAISGGAPPLLAAAVAARLLLHRKRGPALHGSAKWASWFQVRQSGMSTVRKPTGHGIILGRVRTWLGWRYLELSGQEHVSLSAKTGAGKDVSFVIPNCLAWLGSLVVLDVKREDYRKTAGHRARMGQEVYLFDPVSPTDQTHRWNPFGTVERTSRSRFDQLQRVMHLWFPESTGKEKYWDDAGRSAAWGVSVILAETPSLPLNPGTLINFFSRGDGGEVLAKMIEQRRKTRQPYSQAAVNAVSDYLNGSADQVNGIRKTVSSRLAIFLNPQIAAATEVSDFDIREVRRRPMSIFVGVSPGNIRRLRPLLAVLFQQLVELNTDVEPSDDPTLKYTCLIMLNEFVRLGKMPVLAEAAAYVRSFGLRMAYVIQNKAQLRALYGADGAEDILDNVGAEIVFGTNDQKLCNEVSERVGYDTVQATSTSRPRFFSLFRHKEQSQTEHQHKRALLLPQEVAQMPPDEQIIFRAALPPIRTGRVRWFEDWFFAPLAAPTPAAPVLAVPVPDDDGKTRILPKAHHNLPNIRQQNVQEPAEIGEEGGPAEETAKEAAD